MTQITKTLSIAGIIVLATAPAMAEIASTQYVQNIVNNIPKPAAATASSAGLTKLYTGVGTNTDGAMTQKAITDALNSKLSNNTTAENSLAIGNGAQVSSSGSIQLGPGTNDEYMSFKVALVTMEPDGEGGYSPYGDNYTLLDYNGKIPEERLPDSLSKLDKIDIDEYASGHISLGSSAGVSIGYGSADAESVAINGDAESYSIAIGGNVTAYPSSDDVFPTTIQLGSGTNSTAGTFNVYLSDGRTGGNYTLLDKNGKIPAERLSGGMLTNNVTSGNSIAIGNNATIDYYESTSSIAIGNGTRVDDERGSSIAIGVGAQALDYDVGSSVVAIGPDAKGNYAKSTAIGAGAQVNAYEGTAIGYGAKIELEYGGDYSTSTVQLGPGTNTQDGTFQVVNYQLLDNNGRIPYQRFAPTPDATCKASVGQKCALVVTWDGTKYSQSWEVVRSTSSGQ